MSTRKIVPNGDNEGGLGTADKRFASIYVTAPETGANDSRAVNAKWVQALVAQAKKDALLEAHPVGSYYWSNDNTSPATLFGGTWESLPAGYTLIAQGSGSDSFGSFTYEAGKQYGERKHQLTTDELPKISGSVSSLLRWNSNKAQSGVLKAVEGTSKFPSSSKESASNSTISIEFGNNVPHENLPPSIASYGWRRTA